MSMIKTILLTSLCLLLQSCDREQQRISETSKISESSAQQNSEEHALYINDRQRFVLTGNPERLTINCQVYESEQWIEQSSCLVELLKDAGKNLTNEEKPSQEGCIFIYESRDGTVGYHSTIFYHRASGLLIQQIRCDQPGLLNVRASLIGGQVTGRTEMQFSGEQFCTGALFIPFEAEVVADGNSLVIEGEGELVLVMSLDTIGTPQTSVATKWRQACLTYDPDSINDHDVIKVTNALRSECEAQSENP